MPRLWSRREGPLRAENMTRESSGRLVSDYCRQLLLWRIDDVNRRSFIGLSETATRRKGADKRTVGLTGQRPAAGLLYRRPGDRLGAAPHCPND